MNYLDRLIFILGINSGNSELSHRSHDLDKYGTIPALSKKIIYVDQFAISYMVRTLHPKMKATGNERADSFWIQLYQKLDKLVKMQIIICPQSHFHFQESVVSVIFEPLEKMYQLLSRGFKFVGLGQIKKQQIRDSVRNWLDKEPKHQKGAPLYPVFHRDINSWLPKTVTYQHNKFSPDYKKVLRESREKIHRQWVQEFYLWKENTNTKFEEWREVFYFSLLKGILSSSPDFIKYIERLPVSSSYQSELSSLVLGSLDTLKVIQSIFQEEGIKEQEWESYTWHFLQSEYFRQIPFIKLYALFYASFARKAVSGQKRPPDQGIANDLNIISLLLPYCDVLFIDNQCRACLEEKDVLAHIDYKTKVFSLTNEEEFLAYLENLEAGFPPEYLEKVFALYGKEWINTPTQLY